ncbi:MAG: gluconate 2-dehydrogenase subunit 3 family protein [Chitinophagaceae bacterium]
MQRRSALKRLLIVVGGVIVIPACLNEKSEKLSTYPNLSLTRDDEETIGAVAETILPAGKSPGALDTGAHLFALRMINDCSEKEVQKSFLQGLQDFKAACEKEHGQPFIRCAVPKQQQIIASLEKGKEKTDTSVFYKTLKQYSIRGYLNSKPVLGTILEYKLVPGKYNGSAILQNIIHPA